MSEPVAAAGEPVATLRSYDPGTIAFHWVTAVLVLVLFASMRIRPLLPRDWHLGGPLESFHVSIGILFAAVLVLRLVWRLVRGRRLPPAGAGVAEWAARSVHFALYLLLVLQVGLGFGLRWFQGEGLSFFGLFSLPDIVERNRGLAHSLEGLHDWVAWALIIVAGGHALAALVHHYVVRDRVLTRMLPAAG
jgi:cytochrome b561